MILRFLAVMVFLVLLVPVAALASRSAEREELTDAQLLEVLAQEGDNRHDPQLGVATYYASRFIGRRTSSGRPYHPDKYTAAHAVLPLGTAVTVENLKTGQKVAVTINDRCRKRSFQLIDLSRIAAQEIGLWGKGVVKVRIIPITRKDPLQELLAATKE
jgi:rare lipoprotein A